MTYKSPFGFLVSIDKLDLISVSPVHLARLKAHQGELCTARVMMEAEMATQGMRLLSVTKVKGYLHDLVA